MKHTKSLVFGALLLLSVGGCGMPIQNPGDGGIVNAPTLEPPPPGRGMQIKLSFTVPTGSEQQRCWRFRLPTTQDMEVVRYEVQYNVGSHHMNLFRVLPSVEAARTTPLPAETGLTGEGESCFNAIDFDTYDLVVGSQNERLDWQLPAGIAYRLHAGSAMLIQSHFVNGATQNTPGNRAEVRVNLWTAENPSSITQHMNTVFANNRAINLPPRSPSTFTTFCRMPANASFIAMTGHFHSRGRRFKVSPSADGTTASGAECYNSGSWGEPPFNVLPTPVNTVANGGLLYTCEFFNSTDLPITFGPRVEFEEHCNLFAYYYPAEPDSRARYCF